MKDRPPPVGSGRTREGEGASSSDDSGNRIQCPQCGGESELPPGRRLVECEYCGGTLFVDRSAVVSHYSVPALLDRDAAAAALRRWMAGNETVKDLDRKSALESLAGESFPMWLFRVRQEGGEEVHVEPAAPTPIPQLADLKVPAGSLKPFRKDEIGFPAVSAIVPLETARGWLEQRGVSSLIETALVRIPLWRARYSFEGRSYEALVDASTGAVLAAVYPEKMEAPYYLVAALGLVLFGLEGLLIGNIVVKLLAFMVTGVPLVLLAYWVTRRV